MATKYVCDRCKKEFRESQLFEVRLLSKNNCNEIPSGLLFGLQGEYCEECAKIIQRFLQTGA
jgi:hypothetical protein